MVNTVRNSLHVVLFQEFKYIKKRNCRLSSKVVNFGELCVSLCVCVNHKDI